MNIDTMMVKIEKYTVPGHKVEGTDDEIWWVCPVCDCEMSYIGKADGSFISRCCRTSPKSCEAICEVKISDVVVKRQ